MQTREQRQYWAKRRAQERARTAQAPKDPRPTKVVLVAMSDEEYRKMTKDFPDHEVRLDLSAEVQLELFPTYEYKKNRVRKDF